MKGKEKAEDDEPQYDGFGKWRGLLVWLELPMWSEKEPNVASFKDLQPYFIQKCGRVFVAYKQGGAIIQAL